MSRTGQTAGVYALTAEPDEERMALMEWLTRGLLLYCEVRRWPNDQ